jgi:hypothetical protein
MTAVEAPNEASTPLSRGSPYIGSLLLHALVLLFLLYSISAPEIALPAVPVDLIELAEETISPAAEKPAVAPPRQSNSTAPGRLASVSPPRPAPRESPKQIPPAAAPAPTVAPSTVQPAPDALPPPQSDRLQTQLEALAQLRAPGAAGTSGRAPTGSGAGTGPLSAYSVKDLIRAQIQRRWNLKLDELGEHNFVVSIHIVLARDGSVMMAEIVDQRRFASDAAFYSIAISARNAVLLASPLALPSGISDDDMDLTLNLNTRDVLR